MSKYVLYFCTVQHYKTSRLQVPHFQLRKIEETHQYWELNLGETGSYILLNNCYLFLEGVHFNTKLQFTLIAQLSRNSQLLHLPMLKNMFFEQLFFNCDKYQYFLIAKIKSDHRLKRQNHLITSLLLLMQKFKVRSYK